MRHLIEQLMEATSVDPDAPDPQDEARRMIEHPKQLYDTLESKAERILQPAFANAKRKLDGYSRIGLPTRAAPDLFNSILVPALRKYADEVNRMAEAVAKKFA
ncbi:MAG: hypothetical protein WC683_01465 [bacterium]